MRRVVRVQSISTQKNIRTQREKDMAMMNEAPPVLMDLMGEPLPDPNLLPQVLYISVNYTPDQDGREIREQDIVRPANHRWCRQGGTQTATWRQVTRGRCPTYGSCCRCLKSGPIGKGCDVCMSRDAGYVIMLSEGQQVLDSVALAGLYERGHEVARADRIYKPEMFKTRIFDALLRDDVLPHVFGQIANVAERQQRIDRALDEYFDLIDSPEDDV